MILLQMFYIFVKLALKDYNQVVSLKILLLLNSHQAKERRKKIIIEKFEFWDQSNTIN